MENKSVVTWSRDCALVNCMYAVLKYTCASFVFQESVFDSTFIFIFVIVSLYLFYDFSYIYYVYIYSINDISLYRVLTFLGHI